jgi:hypothetical protein
MIQIEFNNKFWASVSFFENYFDPKDLQTRVQSFIYWKQFNKQKPDVLKKDKSSEMDANNVFFKPYKLNNFWHCHCGMARNGDPLIMYRYIDKETIRLVCITLHDYAFHKELRQHFVDEYSEEFPIKETIEYEDMTDYQKQIVDAGNGPYIEAPVGITLDDKKYREWFDEQLMKAKR